MALIAFCLHLADVFISHARWSVVAKSSHRGSVLNHQRDTAAVQREQALAGGSVHASCLRASWFEWTMCQANTRTQQQNILAANERASRTTVEIHLARNRQTAFVQPVPSKFAIQRVIPAKMISSGNSCPGKGRERQVTQKKTFFSRCLFAVGSERPLMSYLLMILVAWTAMLVGMRLAPKLTPRSLRRGQSPKGRRL